MMKAQIETIDVKVAKRYIARNVPFEYGADGWSNRPIGIGTIQRYAVDMLKDEWMLTHEGIAFDDKGILIDGQQRLMALILAAEDGAGGLEADPNITFTTWVFRGADRATFEYINIGRNRNAGQILAMSGVLSSHMVAAASKIVYMFDNLENYSEWTGGGISRVSNHDIRTIATTTDITEYVHDAAKLQPIGMIPSAALAAMYICNRDTANAPHERFVESLRYGSWNGDTLRQDDPILVYREYLLRSKDRRRGGKLRRDGHKHFFTYMKTWNDHCLGLKRHGMAWKVSEGIILPVESYDE